MIGDSIKIPSGGIICLTGVGAGGSALCALLPIWRRRAVLKNNVIVGSVNANKRHWYRAGENLARADRNWLKRLITRREKPENFQQALERNPTTLK